jgi:putative ABC transport system permease protein
MTTTVQLVDIQLGAGGPPTQRRVFFGTQKTKPIVVLGTTENFAEGTRIPIMAGRFFNGTEVQYRKNVVVLGNTPYQLLFQASGTDPIGKMVRVGNERFEVVGVFDKRPAAGGFNLGQDDFVVIAYTAYQRIFGLNPVRISRTASMLPIMIAVLPRDGVPQEDAIADVERAMRIRHGLRLDEPNDFDIVTQDAFLKLWDRISQGTFFALVVISSIALMVGGIGVMAIMSISVTERTREIGVRKALGARRIEILFQFLMEAAFLTSLGGLLGIALGSGIGWAVHAVTGFPISLPWWSFAIGLGFSASVGIFFGMWPAVKASRLDPIEALRYE